MRGVWDDALHAAREAHTGPLATFCPFPDDLVETEVQPQRLYAGDLFATDRAASAHPLARALQAAAPLAHWRETYRGTDIFPDFLRRFGCFALIGDRAPFFSQHMKAFLVYLPPRLDYPFHHHPADEIYFILAGKATFLRDGAPDETFTAGMWCQHGGNQPHATRTQDAPLIAYVLWRSHLDVLPAWTERA